MIRLCDYTQAYTYCIIVLFNALMLILWMTARSCSLEDEQMGYSSF